MHMQSMCAILKFLNFVSASNKAFTADHNVLVCVQVDAFNTNILLHAGDTQEQVAEQDEDSDDVPGQYIKLYCISM